MSGMRLFSRSCIGVFCAILAISAAQSSAGVSSLWITVADGQNNLLPQASVAAELTDGGVIKATPAGLAQWLVKQPHNKIAIQVSDRNVGSAVVELELPDYDEVSVVIYLEGKDARVEIVSPRPGGIKASLDNRLSETVLRGGPIPVSFGKTAPPQAWNYVGPGPAGGEDCATATVIPGLPFSGSGSTTGAVNNYDAVCPFTGSTSPDLVYSYTPTSNVSVNINLCGSGYDTKVYVYDGTCGGTFLACNDDGCPGTPPAAYRSRIECLALTAGTTYYIVVDGYGGDSGSYTMDITECTPCDVTCQLGGGGGEKNYKIPANVAIPDNNPNGVTHSFIVPDSGIIADVNVDLSINHTWVGDLIVTVSHGGTSVTIIDRPGVPASSFGCSANNYSGIVLDDEGGGGAIESICIKGLMSPPNYTPNNPLSAFDGMEKAGEWTITVSDRASGDTGTLLSWSLHITNQGDPGKLPENEPNCGLPTDTVNGGCNSVPPVFSPISCGDAYCATGAFDGATRDTDWYRVVLPTDQYVTWCATAEFDLLIGIVNNFGIDSCAGVSSFLTFGTGESCEEVCVSACLGAGTWYLFVAPQFADIVPCGAEYNANLSCDTCPTGGCCLPSGACVADQTTGQCAAQGGTYQGDGSGCDPNPCPQPPNNDECEDAITLPVPGSVTGSTVAANPDGTPFCGTSNTAPGVWYQVIGNGNTITASLCNPGTNYDTKIHVYCPDCDNFACVAGNDDFCGFPPGHSQVSWCSDLGQTYLILVSGFGTATGNFELTLAHDGMSCSTPPSCVVTCGAGIGDCCVAHPNTGCDDAECCQAVCAIDPFCCDVEWDGICADEAEDLCPACAPEPCDVTCNGGGPTDKFYDIPANVAIPDNNPAGVNHSFIVPDAGIIEDLNVDLVITHTWVGDLCVTLTHGGVTVNLIQEIGNATPGCGVAGFGCSSNNLNVILDDEGTGGALDSLPCPGDANPYHTSPPNYTPISPLSAFDGMDKAGEWILNVRDTAGGDTGTLVSWSLHFSNQGEAGKLPENEPNCGLPEDTVNGGCNSIPPVFSPISCGEAYCGTAAFDGSLRDTDWYRVVLTQETYVTWSVTADFDVLVGIVNNFGIDSCAGVTSFLAFATGEPCDLVTVSACLAPGTWYLFVAPQFAANVPCGAFYNAELTCGECPTGACCLNDQAGTCVNDTSAPDCAAQGGTYQGDNSVCTPGLCPIPPANDLCTDAITIGVPSVTSGSTALATVDNGFPSPCGTGDAITSPGVWYEVMGTGGTMTASTCTGTAYDSKITVYCRDCQTPLCVTGNDDSCGLQSSVTWCSQSGATYLILVHGFGGATGPFELTVTSSGSCSPPTVECIPPQATGACCAASGCSIQTEAACDAVNGQWLGPNTQCELAGPAHSYVASPNVAIPDNLPAGVQHVINVPDNFTVGDLNVDVVINHTWVGDLIVRVTHGSTTVELINQPGDATNTPGSPFGCSADNYNIILDDEGTGGAIEGLCVANLTSPPNYTPDNPLSAFDGMNASGAWTITVIDTAAADTGTLVQWSLHFTEPGEDACEPRGACCIHPTCEILTQADCDAAGGTYQGDNTQCSSPGQTVVYDATPSLAIPDNNPAGVQHVINVPASMTIEDLNVDLVITHTWVGDLTVRVSHNATTVTIVDRPGVPTTTFGCSQDNYDIILDDEGTGGPIETLCNAAMVSPPNYTPNNPLSAFDGMDAAGAWTITVIDGAAGDTGTLVRWSLHISGAGESICVFTGACCDRSTGCCVDDVPQDECAGQWYKAESCDEIEPPCSMCGNGIVECGEQCDGGPCCNQDCTYAASSTECRPAAGVCDVADFCTGNSGTCPADAKSTAVCRPAAGACDVAESCDGVGNNCPLDGFASSSTVCRASAGPCDVAENCTGNSANCPADGFAPSSQECRASAGICDVAENCSGSGADCPADGFVAGGSVCRPAQGDCDVAEACSGNSADCPPNGFSSGNVCRPSTGPCDPEETCSGQVADCPPNTQITACMGGDGCCPSGCTSATDTDCPSDAIPTVGEWGLAILTLLLLVAGKLYFGRRQEEIAA